MLIKTKLMLLFVFIFLISIMFLIYYDLMQKQERSLYLANDLKQRNIVLNSLFQNRRNSMMRIADDYSLWDDMIDFFRTNDENWAKEYIDPILTIYGYDLIWLFDSNEKVRYHSTDESFSETIQFDKNVFKHIEDRQLTHFFYSYQNHLIEMVAATIHPTNDDERKQKSTGFLLFGKVYNSQFLGELENQTDYRIHTFPVSTKKHSSQETSEVVLDIPLYNHLNEQVYVLRFAQENAFLQSLQRTHKNTLLVFFLSTVIFLIGVYFLFHYWIRKPLKLISDSLQTGSLEKIQDVAKRNNEFGNISKMIIHDFQQAETLQKETEARLAAKQKLIETTDRFYKIFQHSPDLILITQNNRILEVNNAFLKNTGLEEAKIIGKEIEEIGIFPGKSESIKNSNNTFLHLATKKQLDVLISEESIDFEQQKCKLYMMRNITEEIKLEKQMIQAHKMDAISSLAAGIAHDFNNILNVIMGYTASLKATSLVNTEHYEKLQMIENASERAQGLVKQIVMLSKHQEQMCDVINLNEIIKQALKFLKPSIPSYIKIVTKLTTTATIYADPVQIYQLIINLCTNAFQSIYPKEGKIEISLSRETEKEENKEYACLKISDNGCGISESMLETIFEPYVSTKNEHQGLGLAIVKGIVERFKGILEVQSKTEEGTTFTIYFPLSNKKNDAIEIKKDDTSLLHKTVLFVEDEEELLSLFRETLLDADFGVISANSSRKALDIFFEQRQHIDIIVTDYSMPEMSGIELIKHVRNYDSNIPIILYSGFKTSEIQNFLKELNISAFLLKPIIPAIMLNTIKKVLQNER